MRVTFDPTFDATPCPGPLGGRDATAGEAWAGPRFLLNLLETQLGLGGPVEADIMARIGYYRHPARDSLRFLVRRAD